MKLNKTASALLVVAAGSASMVTLAADDLARGKLDYEANCLLCHGVSGKGDGPYAKQLKVGSPDLTVLAEKNGGKFPTARVLATLDGRDDVQAHGPREMPIWGEVYLAEGPQGTTAKEREPQVDARLRALVAYLESIQGLTSTPPSELAMGKLDYEAKCVMCHGVSGKGDGPFAKQLQVGSPDLTVLAQKNAGTFPTARVLATLDGRADVQAHGPREMPIWGEVYLAEGPQGTTAKEREPQVDARLRGLVVYLESLQK